MGTPSVSVIIPVYNGEQFLAEAITSVLDQSEPPEELIVVDDGSLDHSADIARSFAPEVQLLQLEKNTGQYAAQNLGVQHARHELLAFLDADDIMVSDRLELQRECLQNRAEIDIVVGQTYRFYQGEDPLRDLQDYRLLAERTASGFLCGSMMCRRSVFEKTGPFEGNSRLGQMIDWFAKAQDQHVQIEKLPSIFVCRRIHGRNAVLTGDKTEFAYAIKAILDRRRAFRKGA